MNTSLLVPSIVFEEGFHQLEFKNKTINFYTIIPLHQEEVDLKLQKGLDALFDGFDKYDVTDIVEVGRPNSLKKKKWLGLF